MPDPFIPAADGPPGLSAADGPPVVGSATAGDESHMGQALPTRKGKAAAELALIVAGDRPTGQVLLHIAELAVVDVEGVEEASVTFYHHGAARSVGVSGPKAAALDERQYHSGFGPCLHAARTGQPVSLSLAESEASGVFDDFAHHARRVGVLSISCLPLEVPDRIVGAINLYSPWPRPLQGDALRTAGAFAAAAAVVVAAAGNVALARDAETSMRAAMEHRSVIEQAKGVLMAELRVDADAAFEVLRRRSSHANVKLRDVAAAIVDSVTSESTRPA